MELKINNTIFSYLMKNLPFVETKMNIINKYEKYLIIQLDESMAEEIREWALDKQPIVGFDEMYELTKEGMLLDEIVDLFET